MTTQTIPPPSTRPAGSPWPMADAAQYVGISIRTFYRFADAGKIKTLYFGRRRLVPDSEVRRLAEQGCR